MAERFVRTTAPSFLGRIRVQPETLEFGRDGRTDCTTDCATPGKTAPGSASGSVPEAHLGATDRGGCRSALACARLSGHLLSSCPSGYPLPYEWHVTVSGAVSVRGQKVVSSPVRPGASAMPTAKYFVKQGWRAVTCSRDAVPPQCGRGERHMHICADLADLSGLPHIMAELELDLLEGQPINALVNNAGYSPKGERRQARRPGKRS